MDLNCSAIKTVWGRQACQTFGWSPVVLSAILILLYHAFTGFFIVPKKGDSPKVVRWVDMVASMQKRGQLGRMRQLWFWRIISILVLLPHGLEMYLSSKLAFGILITTAKKFKAVTSLSEAFSFCIARGFQIGLAILMLLIFVILMSFTIRVVVISVQLYKLKLKTVSDEESAIEMPAVTHRPADDFDRANDSDDDGSASSYSSHSLQGEETPSSTNSESPEVVIISPAGRRSVVIPSRPAGTVRSVETSPRSLG